MVRISEEQYRQFLNKSIDYKQSKYHNKKVVYDGIKFDSKKEGSYYLKLKLLEEKGIIKDLKRQVEWILIEPFVLNGKKYRKTSYICDFAYKDKENKLHVIDVKSEATKTQVYLLKKKLMACKHGIEIEEI
jgi:hypothetical protein